MSESVYLPDLLDLLDEAQNPGDFACKGHFTSLMPGLYVKGIGAVSLPLMPTQAKTLIALCEQAPFGRGEDTVVDTSVRNCWQLDASMFELRNPKWQSQLQTQVGQIAWQLGLNGCEVVFEPYKLLIYEQGSFFVRHRDTEKMPSMFATMVVGLPGEHEGGELVISHGDESMTVSFAQTDGFSSDFAAFYADCYHEVKPVKSGYRLCLVYNLAIKHRVQQPLYTDTLAGRSEVSNFVAAWSRSEGKLPLMAYLLEHSYTEQNLCLDNLKNGDHSKVHSLMNAAVENDCEAYLCLVSYYRESFGDVGYHHRYGEPDEDDFEEFDVEVEQISACEFIGIDGTKRNLGEITLYEEDLLARIGLFDGPGRECTISEATGNAGATKELWYHRGAVVLWPKSREIEVMKRAGCDYKAHYLAGQVQAGAFDDATQKAQLRSLVKEAVETDNPDWVNVLLAYDEPVLYHLWFDKRTAGYGLDLSVARMLKPIAEQIGWHFFDEKITQLLAQRIGGEEWVNALLKTGLDHQGKTYAAKWLSQVALSKPTFGQYPVSSIIQNVALLGLKTRAEEAMEMFAHRSAVTFLTKSYGPAIIEVLTESEWLDADKGILQGFVDDVLARIAQVFPKPVTPPQDWAREGQLKCSCEFCQQVNDFLPDPERRQMQLNTFKKNLLHVENHCRGVAVDVDVTVERAPKRFMGTFVKNQKSFERNKQTYIDAMAIVDALKFPMGIRMI